MLKKQLALFLILLTTFSSVTFATHISRLHEDEIQDGSPILADDLNDEFDQLVAGYNTHDDLFTVFQTGNIVISGTKTFTGDNIVSGNNLFSGNNSFTGLNTFSKQINLLQATDPASPLEGDLWYNNSSDVLKFQGPSSTKTIATIDSIPSYSRGYIAPVPPVWLSASQVQIPAGFGCRSQNNDQDIVVASNITVDLSVSGAAGVSGRDTGSEASSTRYYLWIRKHDTNGTVIGQLSTSKTTPASISGFNTYVRLLPVEFYNDGSSNLIPVFFENFGNSITIVKYNVTMANRSETAGPTNKVATATPGTSLTTLDLSPYGGDMSDEAILHFSHYGGSTASSLLLQGNGLTNNVTYQNTNATQAPINGYHTLKTDSTHNIQYQCGVSDVLRINVAGYYLNKYTNGF